MIHQFARPRSRFPNLARLMALEARLAPARLPVIIDTEATVDRLRAAPLEFAGAAGITLTLPRPDGATERFAMWQTTMMEPGLAAQLPGVRTYRGQSLDWPGNILAADVGPNGFHAKVDGPGGLWYIDPTDAPHGQYVAYSDSSALPRPATPPLHDAGPSAGAPTPFYSTGPILRTFRLAVAATGEYTAFSGGTVPLAQANIVTLVNRINMTLERDLTYRLVLVGNNTDVIYTNAATDPFTNDNLFTMTAECQATLDSKIGTANYDIGHVFGSDGFGGGVGYFGLGRDPDKGRGATKAPNWSTPTSVIFEENITHEMAHQAGAHHTFNGVNGAAAGNRTGSTAVEVGSGSTIMSYAGSCGADDLQSMPDLYFHSLTYDEIQDFIAAVPNVGGMIATGNTAPTVFGGLDATIPANTPFALTASANDINGDTLTYSWEERDVGPAQALGIPDNGQSPIFRAFAPVTSPTRNFPNLASLAAGTASKGETLPTSNRALNFRVYVRDNRAGGGGVTLDDVTVNVVNTGSTFAVTSPNTAVSLPAGSSQLITWNVAGTTAAPINATRVNIRLSTDGGLTYPTVLAADTPNDGAEPITLPLATTTTARIKVEAAGNYFFDIGDVNFAITTPSTMQVSLTAPAAGTVVSAPFTTIDVTFTQNVKASTIGTDDLVLSQGTVTAAVPQTFNTARYTLSGITGEGTVTITMPNGAVTDPDGQGVSQFIANYLVDVGTVALPTPLVPANPVGSLVYAGSVSGAINSAGDNDAYTINLDAGSSLNVTALTASGLVGQLEVTTPGGTKYTSGDAITLSGSIVTAGTYTIGLTGTGGTTGAYTVQVLLNAVGEFAANDSTGTATPLTLSETSFQPGVGRLALSGVMEGPTAVLPAEMEPNNDPAHANDASRSFAPYAGNLYHMGVEAIVGAFYFKLGQIDTTDIFTGTMSGKASGRGTMNDPGLYLYYNGNQYYFGTGDDNSGPGNDALIHHFVPDVSDNYLAGAFGFGFFGDTFQLGFLMENGGTPPLTSESITKVTTNNNSYETAADISKSWRPVQYRGRTSGTITAGDIDVVKYQFRAGDLVTILADSTSDLDVQVTLRNAGGTAIAFDNGSNGGISPEEDAQLLAFVIPTTGDYFVEVQSAGGTGSYNLDLLLSAKIAPPAPVDFAAITLSAGDVITAGLKAQTAGIVAVDLVDAGNNLLQAGAAGPTNFDRVLTFTAPSAGTYYLRVQGEGSVPYLISVARNSTMDLEPNDEFATAQPLINNHAIGGIGSGDEDWYQLAVTAGQVITLLTGTVGSGPDEFVNTLDPIIELFGPDNKLITGDDNSAGDGKNAKLTAAATATGNYRVRVRGVGASAGEYTLAGSITTPTKIASVQVNGGANQRSRVTSIQVTFDQPVTLPTNPADAFQLQRQSDNAVIALAAAPAGNIVTLTFTGGAVEAGSLADGRYTLKVLAAQIPLLDGNGDGTPGDDYVLVGDPAAAPKLFRLFGDADGDNDVDTTDFGGFRAVFGGASSIFDFDNDGDVDTTDFGAFRGRFGASV